MQLVFAGSGNLCRSPLALCAWRLAVREISERGGSKGSHAFALEHIEALSAGLGALPGAGAAPHAQTVARFWGEDLSSHQAALFGPEHAAADLIVTMTGDQSSVVRTNFDAAAGKIRLLGHYLPRETELTPAALWTAGWEELSGWPSVPGGGADILDPLGGSLEAYEACATQIRRAVFELARTMAGLL